jgi:hypothetical protein
MQIFKKYLQIKLTPETVMVSLNFGREVLYIKERYFSLGDRNM